ncbi:S9 family peptidase [Nocardioides aurantiacus]|uniref:Dipeptidyl aminopeptidase/acylaminoacyl peptidase n=1 Tax=Nocardioides aurantiacus TaxID=86796 RepID=A0A3N2CVM7_9ACTN|nr:S9 family peptidase [Nocardioides aurantiacus]ROR91600.1 dipeptidyl aminopeptidase/acylaminoacyl peptidase [Nocardioides aurantiacus]
MRPDDLDLLHACGRPALTPDGRVAVVAVTRPDLASDSYGGQLWRVPTDGSGAVRLTTGHHDRSPAVSPDGRRVAFLRSSPGTPPQLHLTALDGGEPLRLTDHPLGAGAAVWSPDGTRLAYAARVPEPGRYGTADDEGRTPTPDAEPARLIAEPAYRRDDVGFTRDRRHHLFVLAVPPADATPGADLPVLPLAPRQVTDGDADDTEPAWSPDGTRLAFLSSRHEGHETDLRSGVHLVAADAGAPEPAPQAVLTGDRALGGVQWSPDGRLVVTGTETGPDGLGFVGRKARAWVTERPVADQEVDLRPLTEEADLELAGGSAALVVAGGRVLVQDEHRGRVRLVALDPDGVHEAEVLLDGRLVVAGHAASPDGATVLATVADPERAGDLAVVRDGATTWLTDVSASLRHAGVSTPVEVEATLTGGHLVHGWVVLPDPGVYGEGPHPVLLHIHGGPHAQYDWALFDEAQVAAGAGYAVVMCNPRGSAGYGPDHARAIEHAMGTLDADDVLAFLDHALAADLPLDADRVGVVGGSYGGYLTATLTTRTDRFVAAVVERGYLDATSFVGSSDIGWFFPGGYHGSADAAAQQSPLTHVDGVTTPTLVIHSEHDWRTPVEQGQRWFTALRLRGVRTELLLFPAEGHELSRSGRPRHRRQRFEHLLRWWAEHLPVAKTG